MYILGQLRKKQQTHNAIVAPADKRKTVVIIDNIFNHKVNTFPTTNHFHIIQKDPTNRYHKQIQNILHQNKNLIEKQSEIPHTFYSSPPKQKKKNSSEYTKMGYQFAL
jgi:hypothetical protein